MSTARHFFVGHLIFLLGCHEAAPNAPSSESAVPRATTSPAVAKSRCDYAAGAVPGSTCLGDLALGASTKGHAALRGTLRLSGTRHSLELETCTCFLGGSSVPMTDRVVLDPAPRMLQIDPGLVDGVVDVEWSHTDLPPRESPVGSAEIVVHVTEVRRSAAQ